MVSFKEVKRYTTLERVANWLGLRKRGEHRYDCPHSPNGQRAITINPDWVNKDGSRGRFTCWACDASGDLIALKAHIHQTDDISAAKELMATFHGYQASSKGLTKEVAEKINSELVYDHPLVQAIGLSVENAKRLGIGFRARGTKRNCVLIPVRDEKGRLLDYLGYSEEKGLYASKKMGE